MNWYPEGCNPLGGVGQINMVRVCMLVFSYYPDDVRVRREAEALVEGGMSVDVVCLKECGKPSQEQVNGVRVYRIKLTRMSAGKLSYIMEYAYFIVMASLMLSWLHLRKQYQVVHVHNMPDILVVCALLPKLTGAKIILDMHDPMPELYETIYNVAESHLAIKLLKLMERISILWADLVITPNISFRNLFVSRRCPVSKIHIIMNSPQESVFKIEGNEYRNGSIRCLDDFVMMYHGLIVERYGLDTAIKAISLIRKSIPSLRFHIYGSGVFVDHALNLIADLNLQHLITFHGEVALEKIASVITGTDVGIIPNKKNPFTDLNFPTRIFECLRMGKAVIAPRTQGIQDYFDEDSLFYFEPDDENDLARVILSVHSDPRRRQAVVNRGMEVYQQHCWEGEKKRLCRLVVKLVQGRSCS